MKKTGKHQGKREANMLTSMFFGDERAIGRFTPFPSPNEARRFARHADRVRRGLKKTRNPHRGRP